MSGWKRGNPRRPPLPSALADSLVLLFATASQGSADTEYSGFYWLLCHAIVQKLNH